MVDRVEISLGMKLPGPREYSSISFNFSYACDAKKGEKPEAHIKRAEAIAESKLEEYYDKYDLHKEDDEEEDDEEEYDE